jgi:succinate dehydrogenase / fumarate reductase membrane anchor subunit
MAKASSLSDGTALRDEVVPRRVRQFGSARDGLREWRLQRLTAIALIPLSLYFAASILLLATSDRKTAADWLAQPVPALLVILVVVAGITHALIGVRSVILDYVHTRTRLLAAELLFACRCGDPRRRRRARCPQALSRPVRRPECPTLTKSSTTLST